jgi:hypothetical protein
VGERLKALFLTYSILRTLNRFITKFNHPPAFDTDQVIVMAVAESVFIVSMIRPKLDFPDQSAFDQQRQGSIDRGSRELSPGAFKSHDQLIRLEMVASRHHLFQNQPSLWSQLQTLETEILLKHLFLGSHFISPHFRKTRN